MASALAREAAQVLAQNKLRPTASATLHPLPPSEPAHSPAGASCPWGVQLRPRPHAVPAGQSGPALQQAAVQKAQPEAPREASAPGPAAVHPAPTPLLASQPGPPSSHHAFSGTPATPPLPAAVSLSSVALVPPATADNSPALTVLDALESWL
ncbi:hypothetical protein HaLaN_01116 [Haematococcus lacustris]|uniref:Uncharacterized protein n=1 Tax=Haematococcus lacustris TaxID=44745 RepID=A0A699YAT3_HAELA|nr:hypothetical protein HaLaN_01116 [Haematococcus lacustris]